MHPLADQVRPLLHSGLDDEASRIVVAELYRRLRVATSEATRACNEATVQTQLASGVALSPAEAAACFLDTYRTRAMLRGSFNAIRDAIARFSNRRIEVVYAGTGPLAPFGVLLMPLLDPQRVRFTMIDIAPAAADAVDSLVRHFEFAQFVRAIVCGDATQYKHPFPIDVIISETMQRTLAREPFVPILRNLRPQLSSAGLIVPERVAIDFGVLDAEAARASWTGGGITPTMDALATVFEVSTDGENPPSSCSIRVNVPLPPDGTKWAALQTQIDVFAGEGLKPCESGLTMPEILWPLSPLKQDVRLEFRYETGTNPGIQWRHVP